MGSLLAGFAACTTEVDYTPAEPSPLTDYYFPTSNPLEQSLLDGTKSFKVTVARANSKGEKVLPISVSCTPDNPFTVPTEVTFADGAATSTFLVEYDLNNVVVNQHYTLTLKIDGVVNTPYSYGTLEIDVLYLPWRDFDENNSMGLYREGLLQTFFNIPNVTYPVKVQKHPLSDKIFRVINPYGEAFPYNEPGDYDDKNDYYMVLNCTDPDGVYVTFGWSGMDWGYGEFWFNSVAGYRISTGQATLAEMKSQGMCGTFAKGIVKFTEPKTFLIAMENYNNMGLYYSNLDGQFKVVLPGFDDEPDWKEVGMCDFTDGLVSPLFGIKDNTYKVLVERSLINKTTYRIVNPWGPESGLVDEAPEEDSYLEFDVADPDFVLLGFVETPFALSSTQFLDVTSMADFQMQFNDMSEADIKAAGYGAKYKNKVLTLAADEAVGLIYDVQQNGYVSYIQADDIDMTETVLDLNTAVPSDGGAAEAPRKVSKKIKNLRIQPVSGMSIEAK